MPLEALEHLMGEETGYIMLHFEIPTEYSREIDRIREEFTDIMEQADAGWAELSIIIRDQELRMVAAPMEQTLSILRMLYPVVIGASIFIGLGLAMIFMIQNAKNAAVMRVLGGTKLKTRIALTAEQLLICMIGLFVGLVVLIITGWGFGLVSSLMLMGLYVIGVLIGAVTGAVLVTNRPALDLLQVKE
jgi:predicted lysophospholipase L1 biosynthesis ABC-type transport system permease subunit